VDITTTSKLFGRFLLWRGAQPGSTMKNMRVMGCQECLRLTAEYTGVTLARFKLDSQYKLALLRKQNSEKMEELRQRLQDAEDARLQAKEKLRQHEAQAHCTTA